MVCLLFCNKVISYFFFSIGSIILINNNSKFKIKKFCNKKSDPDNYRDEHPKSEIKMIRIQ
jgi:hypothetical protein